LLQIYKQNKTSIESLDHIEKGCWVNLTDPTEEELNRILAETQVLPEFLNYPLDPEETSRVERDEDQLLIIVKIPHPQHNGEVIRYETIPLGIILLQEEDIVITVCPIKSAVLDKVVETAGKQRVLSSHIRFIFNIFLRVASEYLRNLRLIDKLMDEYEEELHRSMRNKELIKLLNLEKSLVYFNTSLKANDMVMARLGSGRYLAITEDDEDILEDAQIENQQAIEMAKIYSDILAGMMDAYASVISNNLNIVMKFLTAVTSTHASKPCGKHLWNEYRAALSAQSPCLLHHNGVVFPHVGLCSLYLHQEEDVLSLNGSICQGKKRKEPGERGLDSQLLH